MVVAIMMCISSFSVPVSASDLPVYGENEVVSGTGLDIPSFTANPITSESIFAPGLDADVSECDVRGFYSMNNITFFGSEERPASIDLTFGAGDYEDGSSFDYAARTLGASSDKGGFIAFATEGAAKVKVYASATGTGGYIGITNGVPTSEVTEDSFYKSEVVESTAPAIYEFDLENGGQYAVAATDDFYINQVVVTPLEDDELIISGEVTPGDGDNEGTVDNVDAASANLWLASEGLASDKLKDLGISQGNLVSVTVATNNSYTTKFDNDIWGGSTISGQAAFKLASRGDSFTFTPTKNGSLTLYIARDNNTGNTCTISGGDVNVNTASNGRKTDNAASTTINVVAGTTYTVTANATGECLFALDFVAEGGSGDETKYANATVSVTGVDGVSESDITIEPAKTESGYVVGTEYTVSSANYNVTGVTVDGTGETSGTNTFKVAEDTTTITVTVASKTVDPDPVTSVEQTITISGTSTTGVKITNSADATDTHTITATGTLTLKPNATYNVEPVTSTDTVSIVNFTTTEANGTTAIEVNAKAAVAAKTVDSAVGTVSLFANLTASADNEKISDGDVIADYFTISGSNVVKRLTSGKVDKIQTGSGASGNLRFTTTVPLKVTVPFASTGASNESDLAIRKVGSTENVAYMTVTGTTAVNLVVDELPAGEYEIYSPSTARGTRLFTVTFDEPVQNTGITQTFDITVTGETTVPAVTIKKASDDSIVGTVDATNNTLNLDQSTIYTVVAPEGYTISSVNGTAGASQFTTTDLDGTITIVLAKQATIVEESEVTFAVSGVEGATFADIKVDGTALTGSTMTLGYGEHTITSDKYDITTPADGKFTVDATTTNVSVVVAEKTVTPTGKSYATWFVGRADIAQGSNDSTVFSGAESDKTGKLTKSVDVTLGDTTYTIAQRGTDNSIGATLGTITIPTDVTNATLYIVGEFSSGSGWTLTLTGDNGVTKTDNSYTKTGDTKLVKIEGLTAGTYTLVNTGGKYKLGFLGLEMSTSGDIPVDPSTETTTEGSVEPTSKEYVDVIGTGAVDSETGIVYDFTNADYAGKYAHATGAAANAVYAMADTATNFVNYNTTDGLVVNDGDSTSNAAYIPFGKTLSSGKVTITGTIKAESTLSGQINLVRFGSGVGIRYTGSNAIGLFDGSKISTDTIAYTPGNEISFTWVIDIASKTQSLEIGGKTINAAFTSAQSADFAAINTGSSTSYNVSCKNMTIKQETSVETTTETTTESTTEATTVASNYSDMGVYRFGTGASGGKYNIKTKSASAGNIDFKFKGISTGYATLRDSSDGGGFTIVLEKDTKVSITSANQYGIIATNVDDPTKTYSFVGTKNVPTVITLPAGTYTMKGSNASNNTNLTEMILNPASSEDDAHFTISGKVTDADGNGVAGISVQLRDMSAITGADGSYEFTNVVAGDKYTVTTVATSDYKSASVTVDGTSAADGSTVNADTIVLDYTGSIAVTVTMDGEPSVGATVIVDDGNGNSFEAITNASGVATFNNVKPGTYTAMVDGHSEAATVTVTNTTATATLDLVSAETRTVTVTLTNGNGVTLTDGTFNITDSNGNVVQEVPFTVDTPVEIALDDGNYFAGVTGYTLAPNSFSVSETETTHSFVINTVVEFNPLAPNTTYDFGTGTKDDTATNTVSVKDYNDTFKGENATKQANNFKLVTGGANAETVEFKIDKTMDVSFVFSSKDMTLLNLSTGTSQTISRSDTSYMTLAPGIYRITAKNTGSSGLLLDKIITKGEDTTSATLTLTVNNKTDAPANVTINGVTQEAAVGTSTLTFEALGTGSYDITTDTANVELDLKKVTVNSGATDVAATLNITANVDPITIVLAMNGTPDAVVTYSGCKSGTLAKTNGATATIEVKPGDVLNFKSDAKKINSITKDSDMRIGFDQSSKRIFEFKVPSDAQPGHVYHITFNVGNGYGPIDTTYEQNDIPTPTIGYSQNGFGGSKVEICGADARVNLKYYGTSGSMYDFNKGYSDATTGKFADYIVGGAKDFRYATLSNNAGSYIEFTIDEALAADLAAGKTTVPVLVDTSGSAYKMTDVTTGASVTSGTKAGSKYIVQATPGHTFRITTANTLASAYIKSVRIYNPNNMFFDNAQNYTAAIGTEAEISGSDLSDRFGASMGEASNVKIFRLIGKVTPKGVTDTFGLRSALTDTDKIGWKIMPADAVDAFNTALNKKPDAAYKVGNSSQGKAAMTDEQYNTLVAWENKTTNDISVTDVLNTGVVKLGLDDASFGVDKYSDVYDGPQQGVKAAHLLLGGTDYTQDGSTFTTAYAENFVKIKTDGPITRFYAIPYTVYNADKNTKVYSNYSDSTWNDTNWKAQTGIVELNVAN